MKDSPEILSDEKIEQIEKAMEFCGDNNGIRLVNSHKALQEKFKKLQEFVEEHHGYHIG